MHHQPVQPEAAPPPEEDEGGRGVPQAAAGGAVAPFQPKKPSLLSLSALFGSLERTAAGTQLASGTSSQDSGDHT